MTRQTTSCQPRHPSSPLALPVLAVPSGDPWAQEQVQAQAQVHAPPPPPPGSGNQERPLQRQEQEQAARAQSHLPSNLQLRAPCQHQRQVRERGPSQPPKPP